MGICHLLSGKRPIEADSAIARAWEDLWQKKWALRWRVDSRGKYYPIDDLPSLPQIRVQKVPSVVPMAPQGKTEPASLPVRELPIPSQDGQSALHSESEPQSQDVGRVE